MEGSTLQSKMYGSSRKNNSSTKRLGMYNMSAMKRLGHSNSNIKRLGHSNGMEIGRAHV